MDDDPGPAPTAELSGDPTPTSATAPPRRRGVDVLIAVTALLTIVAAFAVWANRQLLDPPNWSKTSTRLLQNADVRNATADYAVDQLYANVDVAKLIESGLPRQLRPLAGPAAGALRDAAVRGARAALANPRVQTAWARANLRAAQAFKIVVDGGTGPVTVNRGLVTLDLASVIDEVAARLGLPAGLGAKLPPSVGQLRIVQSKQILLVQDIGRGLQDLALALSIAVPLLYLLAIGLARGRRRRTVMHVGIAIAAAGLLILLARATLVSQVPASLVSDASVRPAAHAVVSVATSMLTEVAGELVLAGVVVIIAAWLAGPAGAAIGIRRALAPHLRDHPVPAYGVTVSLIALVLLWRPLQALGTVIGALGLVVLGLLWVTLLRRQVAAEFPDARAGDAVAALRARVSRLRGPEPHG